ncbi:MAG: hypothetical protein MUO76_17040 [Anaerolineaceae bacterium]|nr:hypothetical protein [Anaerolineaceae bacterium]
MEKYKIGTGALIGLLLTAPMTAVMYLANRLVDLPFAPYDLFDWVARILPGPIITFGIDSMVSVMLFLGINVAEAAKTAERAIAVLQFLGAGIVIGAIYMYLMKKTYARTSSLSGSLLGSMFGLPMIGISIAINRSALNPLIKILWLAVMFLGWGLLFSRISTPHLKPPAADESLETATMKVISRRKFLILVGGVSAAITLIGAGLGSLLAASKRRKEGETAALAHEVESTTGDPFPNSNDPIMSAPGTRPEYTPIKNHYKVFITTEPPVIPAAGYMLPITGMVNNSVVLTLDDIHNKYKSRNQYVTHGLHFGASRDIIDRHYPVDRCKHAGYPCRCRDTG